MVFSSEIFLFCFFPAALIGCLICRTTKLQNIWLLLLSIAFYAYGARKVVLVLLFSVFINWAIALLITGTESIKAKRWLLALDVVLNLSYLFYFKYYNFFRDNIQAITGHHSEFTRIALPIGISFFTFQALSYCIDVYRDKSLVQKSIVNVALYITFFPQLIAGPIVRFSTISKEIGKRSMNMEDFNDGVIRFTYGLGKKVLIANLMGIMADNIYAMDPAQISTGTAWLASIAYTFQIFFDFSGYSDMAIGLGRMFGFHFLENFNYPYISRSVSEFWRRWHISLSSWFRDYIYIPLGGNRRGAKRQIFNLAVVWLCTGVWHGANWTFILWGIIYGALIIGEKLIRFDKRNIPAPVGRIYTLLIVNFLWVLFRADNLSGATGMLKTMLGASGTGLWDKTAAFYLMENWSVLILALIVSVPLVKKLKENAAFAKFADIVRPFFVLLVLLLSVSFMVKGAYNPFIYFNF